MVGLPIPFIRLYFSGGTFFFSFFNSLLRLVLSFFLYLFRKKCDIIIDMNGKKLLKEKDKKKLPKIGKLQKKCDKRCQEIGRIIYKQCFICNKPMNVLHHFFPKSVSSYLRYDWRNLIPLCQGCHWRLHASGNPQYEQMIIQQKGEGWYQDLESCARNYVKVDRNYYKLVAEKLENHFQRFL